MRDVWNFVTVFLVLWALDLLYQFVIKPLCKKWKKEPEEIFIKPEIHDDTDRDKDRREK